ALEIVMLYDHVAVRYVETGCGGLARGIDKRYVGDPATAQVIGAVPIAQHLDRTVGHEARALKAGITPAPGTFSGEIDCVVAIVSETGRYQVTATGQEYPSTCSRQ